MDYLAQRFGVPLDRVHIVGHDNVGGPTNADNGGAALGPGPVLELELLHVPGAPREPKRLPELAGVSQRPTGITCVTISPDYATNAPPLTDCDVTGPVALPTPPANFVYLHTAPDPGAPLLSDPTLHTDGSPGTTCD